MNLVTETQRHTFIVSDLHLSDGEEPDGRRPLWRRYKSPEHFIDDDFAALLDHFRSLSGGEPAELILNGDIFDFDCVLAVPDAPPFPVSWLERARGLWSEEAKSVWKLERMLADHPGFLRALTQWMAEGHEIVYVIGNHDLEMHWPATQDLLREALGVPASHHDSLRFCPWFVLSGGDTLVMHGNQLDPYCLCQDPLHPFIAVDGRVRVRLPFGDLAGKMLSNGIGWFNPHVESSFVRPIHAWIIFFYQHILRHQPFILLTWLWSSIVVLYTSLLEGFSPAIRDPLTLEQRVEDTARRAHTTAAVVRALHEVRAHPAVFRPLKVARELWLDRAFLLLAAIVVSIQATSTLHFFAGMSGWWMFAILALLVPPVLFYAARVDSDVTEVDRIIQRRLPLLARIAGVERVVMGHTHRARHVIEQNVELANTGHWAPGFQDMECTVRDGKRGFAWLAPTGGARHLQLREWQDDGSARIPLTDVPRGPLKRLAARLRPVRSGDAAPRGASGLVVSSVKAPGGRQGGG